jgi:hypothetical protein
METQCKQQIIRGPPSMVLCWRRSIVHEIRDSPYGRMGVVADGQGAVFSLITSPQPQ